MVEVDGGVDESLAGEIVHLLIHLVLSHFSHVKVVDLLTRYPAVPKAAPDGGEDAEGSGTGGGRSLLRRSLEEPREGLDVSDWERLEEVFPHRRLVEAGQT